MEIDDEGAGEGGACEPAGSVGLRISARAPFLVEEVGAVMDEHGILQGHKGYGNAAVSVDDRLLAIDSYDVDELELAAPGSVNAVLRSPRAAVLKLTFLSAEAGDEYAVFVRRHAIPLHRAAELLKGEQGPERGVGVVIGRPDGANNSHPVYIVKVVAGGPADRSGVVAEGDELVAVADLECRNEPLSAISNRIVGPDGTQVMLTLKKAGGNAEKVVTLARTGSRRRKAKKHEETHTAELNQLMSRLDTLEQQRKELEARSRRSQNQGKQLKRQKGHWWLFCRRARVSEGEDSEGDDGGLKCPGGHVLSEHNSPPDWDCDVCRQPGSRLYRLRCVQCDYDLCGRCAPLEHKVGGDSDSESVQSVFEEGPPGKYTAQVDTSGPDQAPKKGQPASLKLNLDPDHEDPDGNASSTKVPDPSLPSLAVPAILIQEPAAIIEERMPSPGGEEEEPIDIPTGISAQPESSHKVYACKALTSYQARNPDELSFIKGQVMGIDIELAEPGWYRGSTLDGENGLVPMTHVRIIATPSALQGGNSSQTTNTGEKRRESIAAAASDQGQGAMAKGEDRGGQAIPRQQCWAEEFEKVKLGEEEQLMMRVRREIEEKVRQELSIHAPLQQVGQHVSLQTKLQAERFRMTLGLDFSKCGDEGTVLRNGFTDRLLQDLGDAAGTAPSNFCILRFAPGSIILDLQVRPDPMGKGLVPMLVVRDLQRQVDDPRSLLRNGAISRYVQSIRETSPLVSSPVRAQVSVDTRFLNVPRPSSALWSKQAQEQTPAYDQGTSDSKSVSIAAARVWTPIVSSAATAITSGTHGDLEKFEGRIRQFYEAYAPEKRAKAKEVAILYADDVGSLNQAFLLKYGVSMDDAQVDHSQNELGGTYSSAAAVFTEALHPTYAPVKCPEETSTMTLIAKTPRVLPTKRSSVTSLSSADTFPGIGSQRQAVSEAGSYQRAPELPTVGIQIILGLDFSQCGDEGTVLRAGFMERLQKDLGNAAGTAPSNFCILRMAPGSIVLDIQVRPDLMGKGLSAISMVRDLQGQVDDPRSLLRNGVFSGSVQSIRELSTLADGGMEMPDAIPVVVSQLTSDCVETARKASDPTDVSKESLDSALRLAAHEGNEPCVRELISVGADVTAADDPDGNTALILAASAGHAECVREILAAGADVMAKNRVGNTALALASREGHDKCVRFLVGAENASRELSTASTLTAQERKAHRHHRHHHHESEKHGHRHHHHHESEQHERRHHRRHDRPSFSVHGEVENSPHTMTPQAVEDRMLRRTPRGEQEASQMTEDAESADNYSSTHAMARKTVRDDDKQAQKEGRRQERAESQRPTMFPAPRFPATTYTPGLTVDSSPTHELGASQQAQDRRRESSQRPQRGGIPPLSRHGASVLQAAAGR